MTFYGEMIDNYDPFKDNIYKMFSDYFNNPTMIKIKDINNHSMYLCKLYCLLNRECRYIIALTEKNFVSPGTPEELKTLNWISLQTRTLSDDFHIDTTHGYQALAEGPLNVVIEKINTTKEASTYTCKDIPITITLLHTTKNTAESYQQKGTIILALETFQTIITFRESNMV